MDFIFSISGSLRMTRPSTGEGLDFGSWGENKFQVTKTKRNQARS